MPCIFCEIVEHRAPATVVFQDERVTAFLDVHPRAPTHILIVPNRHIESLNSGNETETVDAAAACLRAAREIVARERIEGYRVVTNVGVDAGQTVFHLHFHLLAGRKMSWPPG